MQLYMGSFSQSYTPCAVLCGEHHLLVYNYMGSFFYMPSAGLYGSFSYMPSAGLRVVSLTHPMLAGISLTRSMLASLCREFLLYKTKRKNVKLKVNKNVHNRVMLLLFKAEVDIQYRLHKVQPLHHFFQLTVLK